MDYRPSIVSRPWPTTTDGYLVLPHDFNANCSRNPILSYTLHTREKIEESIKWWSSVAGEDRLNILSNTRPITVEEYLKDN